MARFKIKFSLEKLSLEVEGSRDDVPHMMQAVGQQVAGMLAPAGDIIEGEVVDKPSQPEIAGNGQTAPEPKPKRTSRPRTAVKPADSPETQAAEWTHNADTWGTPTQDWVTADKAIWLLYVLSKEASLNEASTPLLFCNVQ